MEHIEEQLHFTLSQYEESDQRREHWRVRRTQYILAGSSLLLVTILFVVAAMVK
jgi:hypothetical protein